MYIKKKLDVSKGSLEVSWVWWKPCTFLSSFYALGRRQLLDKFSWKMETSHPKPLDLTSPVSTHPCPDVQVQGPSSLPYHHTTNIQVPGVTSTAWTLYTWPCTQVCEPALPHIAQLAHRASLMPSLSKEVLCEGYRI